jgi:hypothetical protein
MRLQELDKNKTYDIETLLTYFGAFKLAESIKSGDIYKIGIGTYKVTP